MNLRRLCLVCGEVVGVFSRPLLVFLDYVMVPRRNYAAFLYEDDRHHDDG